MTSPASPLRARRPRFRLRGIALLLLGAAVFAGIAVWWTTPLRFAWRDTSAFQPHATDPRVRAEPGTEALANAIAQALPAALAIVEQQQGRAYLRPVTVHVCASVDSFAAFGGARSAGGFVLNGRLFLSPKLAEAPQRLPRVLTHELSHLHLSEPLSLLGYARNIPSWFKEGLAVLVSDGGGAENVSVDEARTALRTGRGFEPEWTGHLRSERSGKSYGLSEHLWYRECSLLVQFLRDRDPAAFQRLLRALEAGQPFRPALEQAYSVSGDTLLAEFRNSLEPQARRGTSDRLAPTRSAAPRPAMDVRAARQVRQLSPVMPDRADHADGGCGKRRSTARFHVRSSFTRSSGSSIAVEKPASLARPASMNST